MPQANAAQKLVESEQRSKGPSHGGEGYGKVGIPARNSQDHTFRITEIKVQDTKTVSQNRTKLRLLLGAMHLKPLSTDTVTDTDTDPGTDTNTRDT